MDKVDFENKKDFDGVPIIKKRRVYVHFDNKSTLQTHWNYVTDPNKIAAHAFLPFIHFKQIFDRIKSEKIKEEGKKIRKVTKESKARDIYYASHIESAIYTYYGAILNEAYNNRLEKAGLDYKQNGDQKSAVVAYRTNLKGKSNIEFAHEAINFIRKTKKCNIIIGDFKKFFDTLNPSYLKKQIAALLGVEELSKDWYAVFKSITQFSSVELSNLIFLSCYANSNTYKQQAFLKKMKSDKSPDFKKYECNCRGVFTEKELNFENIEDFSGYNENKEGNWKEAKCVNRLCRKYFEEQYKESKIDINIARKNHLIKIPEDNIAKDSKGNYIFKQGRVERMGIPQGSGISAVFANVYMFEFDKLINDYVVGLGGKYMRYSDDFIIVLPEDGEFDAHYSFLKMKINDVKLVLEPHKTRIYRYDETAEKPLICCTHEYEVPWEGKKLENKNVMDYLGFSFDGRAVTIREKTTFKFYYRMYAKIDSIKLQKHYAEDPDKVGIKRMLLKYSNLGEDGYDDPATGKKKSGNFLTYVNRAKKVFSGEEKIDLVVKRNGSKIKNRLFSEK